MKLELTAYHWDGTRFFVERGVKAMYFQDWWGSEVLNIELSKNSRKKGSPKSSRIRLRIEHYTPIQAIHDSDSHRAFCKVKPTNKPRRPSMCG